MRILSISLLVFGFACSGGAIAQQRSFAPNTDNDGGQQLYDCRSDIRKYCNGPGMLLFELEGCLSENVQLLSAACKEHIGATDFRKYHNKADASNFFSGF